MSKYPFYIENTSPSLASQLEDAMKALKYLEELKGGKKEEKKDEKKGPSIWKIYAGICLGTFTLIPVVMWLQFTLFLDILTKAQHLPR